MGIMNYKQYRDEGKFSYYICKYPHELTTFKSTNEILDDPSQENAHIFVAVQYMVQVERMWIDEDHHIFMKGIGWSDNMLCSIVEPSEQMIKLHQMLWEI